MRTHPLRKVSINKRMFSPKPPEGTIARAIPLIHNTVLYMYTSIYVYIYIGVPYWLFPISIYIYMYICVVLKNLMLEGVFVFLAPGGKGTIFGRLECQQQLALLRNRH